MGEDKPGKMKTPKEGYGSAVATYCTEKVRMRDANQMTYATYMPKKRDPGEDARFFLKKKERLVFVVKANMTKKNAVDS